MTFTYLLLIIIIPVPFGLLVWSTGLAPNPVVEAVTEVKKDPKTSRYIMVSLYFVCRIYSRTLSLITDENLNVIMENRQPNPDVWAVGDAAQIFDNPLPSTSQGASYHDTFHSYKSLLCSIF